MSYIRKADSCPPRPLDPRHAFALRKRTVFSKRSLHFLVWVRLVLCFETMAHRKVVGSYNMEMVSDLFINL